MSTRAVNTKQQERFLNIDLLRIFSMFLIVFLHSIDHSGVLETAEEAGGFTFCYVFFVYYLCQICVNLFVLISGFFFFFSRFRPEKLLSLWVETVFYSLLFKVIFMAGGKIPFSPVSLVSCFVPIFTGRYWFVTIYFGMYLLMPFLNTLIDALSVRQFTVLNILLFVLFSLWNSFSPGIKGMNSGAGWGLAWFVVMYFAGAWLRICYKNSDAKAGKYFLVWVILAAVFSSSLLIFRGKLTLYGLVRNLYRYDSAPVYISSLLVFIGFMHMRIANRYGKVLRMISGATFGVYLIHAHANVSPWIWEDFTRIASYRLKLSFPFIHFGIVLGLYIVCLILSLAGGKITRLLYGGIKNIAGTIVRMTDKFLEYVMTKTVSEKNTEV